LKYQISNLDKTIQELTNRLDEVHPYSASSSSITNHQNKNDGITYWKGKKIISTKDWNDLYQKSSIYADTYKITLTSRKPLQYFPDDYYGSISIIGIKDESLREEILNWNKEYYDLLEYRKNPTLGRMKCSKCLLSGSHDDPIFVGIEKVFARIVSNQCNKNNVANNHANGFITYHCNVMNIFSCPFESKEESYNNSIGGKDEKAKYPYKREDLFALHQISFAIEQAITTFSEITKDNEIIYEVDFVNDRVQEIHTKYNGELESWGWQNIVKEKLSKVKPISNIVIRDTQDIYNILTNKEKLECLLQEYERQQLEEQEICCDENTPCVNNSRDNEKLLTINNLSIGSNQYQDNSDYLHEGENFHSKNNTEKELVNEHLKSELKVLKEEFKAHKKQQLILLKQNKQNIIDFIIDNKDSIKIEDLKIYEPIYKCYREKGNCHICNSLSNIICVSCSNYNIKEIWLCKNHWKQHTIEKHKI
jgi:hypothetical protein